MTQETFTAAARAETPAAARYLGQLSKHFAHKIRVDYAADATPPEGLAHFPWGTCRMRAEGGALAVEATADTSDGLERIKHVVDDHLRRFAWREKLVLHWD
ncbi:hypothetical protein C882_0176 [Caenispirillum salinarum AK4]|uniref:2,4-dihydroxyhept-2-ene-1,7-dioic acid aldolase n=1 Tax=Caenispirillum salinarum AK4 TaxID=1238182 RepID=K9GVX2_9PROT|nr:DUF2218 domain-containing protein [Caenispirillum salinarum]EKV30095.1 hypothetical protein C882_0176 [Caenispirillum salinarum AK4]